VLDNFSSDTIDNIIHHANNPRELLEGDLKDPATVKEAVGGVDTVFHYAANPQVRVSTTNPETHFNENILATFNLLETMRENGVNETVFTSSSSIYGEPEEIPVNEDASLTPVSVYDASKSACENLIRAYSHLYGIKAVALSYANVVGPRLRNGVVYDLIVKLMKNPKELEILCDGTQLRSYIYYVEDAIEATLIAWEKSPKDFEVYNTGSGYWLSVNDVAKIVLEVIRLVYEVKGNFIVIKIYPIRRDRFGV